MKTVHILNGPNLNMLGTREPELYGSDTLGDIEADCNNLAEKLGLKLVFRQSNLEGELVTWIQEACSVADALILNAAAYTHTSIAILDALKMFEGYIIELHLTDPNKREEFRHVSYVKPAADNVIAGHGAKGYLMALEEAAAKLD